MERLPMETLESIIGIQKTTLEAFEKHGSEDSDYCPAYDKAVFMLLEELKQYRIAEEQGLLLRLPCKLGDIIGRIISHNETVTLMFETEVCSFRGLQHFWHGMAWNIPKEYLELPFVKIHGVVPDKITEADTIWIEVRKEAEQALERMEGEDG